MNQVSKSRKLGALFAEETIVQSEPEIIWDDNNDDPAVEERWLTYFEANKGDIATSEVAFIAEYDRRRGIN